MKGSESFHFFTKIPIITILEKEFFVYLYIMRKYPQISFKNFTVKKKSLILTIYDRMKIMK
ncbi:hypothetical protein A5M96_08270 [Streptococcus pneumoniae]|nr:hypothetical protein A5M96_08270 [Streptococcus pneumoniae]ODO38065.1 hypothetical protein A5N06_04280 [Streptococcus pneumoniae]ODO52005.1 hypothetical protein A5N55_09525 [Streptococcus pneumoniae]ODO54155.1 hypothetical protein A5N56_04700 [Streptococcus pneumoniae]OYL14709.1 hypothetical protein A5N52_10060 [Streptococcus pneumoniae]